MAKLAGVATVGREQVGWKAHGLTKPRTVIEENQPGALPTCLTMPEKDCGSEGGVQQGASWAPRGAAAVVPLEATAATGAMCNARLNLTMRGVG